MVRDDRSVRVLLGVIAILLGLNLLVQVSGLTGPRVAMAAGIPDSGAQLQAMVEKTADISKKLDKLQAFLESGELTVKVKELPKSEK
ncbi:MAG: hypothetical protein FWD61_13440 [Phycisphaerales bacterium]|nr:hypothetical protein [Phycisphaerales bacterium]